MEKTEFSKKNSLALKGIAIMMMVFHHCFWGSHLFENYDISFMMFTQKQIEIFGWFLKICVSIFVFITGYGCMLSLKKIRDNNNWNREEVSKWVVNRIVKGLSGFWIIAILSYIICQIIDGRTYEIFFTGGILNGCLKMIIDFFGMSNFFGFSDFNSAWWYMNIYILFIISLPIFVRLFQKYGYVLILILTMAIPRVFSWQFLYNSYITYLYALLFGIIFADNNLLVKIANFKIHKNKYINKILKFIIETVMIVGLYMLDGQMEGYKLWELKYTIIPVVIICYLYEFYLELPILKNILQIFGKYSMDIFLIHEFFRGYYLSDFIYSFKNFILIWAVLLLFSLVVAILLELFKKLIRYDNLIDKIQKKINNKISKIYDK